MNAITERLAHTGGAPSAKLIIRGIFAFGMLALILGGAASFLMRIDYTTGWQILMAMLGGFLGGLIAGRLVGSSSRK